MQPALTRDSWSLCCVDCTWLVPIIHSYMQPPAYAYRPNLNTHIHVHAHVHIRRPSTSPIHIGQSLRVHTRRSLHLYTSAVRRSLASYMVVPLTRWPTYHSHSYLPVRVPWCVSFTRWVHDPSYTLRLCIRYALYALTFVTSFTYEYVSCRVIVIYFDYVHYASCAITFVSLYMYMYISCTWIVIYIIACVYQHQYVCVPHAYIRHRQWRSRVQC
jgi:hypothetical protein